MLDRDDGRVGVGVTGTTIGGGGGGGAGGGATDIGSWCCWAVVIIVFRFGFWFWLCLMNVDKRDADIFSSEWCDSKSLPIISLISSRNVCHAVLGFSKLKNVLHC